MGKDRVASGDLERRLIASGLCPYVGDAYGQIIDWGKTGAIVGFSPKAIVNDEPQFDYEIPKQAWHTKLGWGGSGRFDPGKGHLTVRFSYYGRNQQRLTAADIEFELSEAVAALMPIEAEPPASAVKSPALMAVALPTPKRQRKRTPRQLALAAFETWREKHPYHSGETGDALFATYKSWCVKNGRPAYGRSAYYEERRAVRS